MVQLTYQLQGVKYGYVGRHLEWVEANVPTGLIAWAQTLFVMQLLFGFQVALTKTSILLLYRRIFQVHKWFRYLIYGLIAYIWAWAIGETLTSLLQCRPLSYVWYQYDPALHHTGTCIDLLAYYRWIGPPNSIHDLAMVVIPAAMVWTIKTSTHQKIALTGVFLLGSLYDTPPAPVPRLRKPSLIDHLFPQWLRCIRHPHILLF